MKAFVENEVYQINDKTFSILQTLTEKRNVDVGEEILVKIDNVNYECTVLRIKEFENKNTRSKVAAIVFKKGKRIKSKGQQDTSDVPIKLYKSRTI